MVCSARPGTRGRMGSGLGIDADKLLFKSKRLMIKGLGSLRGR